MFRNSKKLLAGSAIVATIGSSLVMSSGVSAEFTNEQLEEKISNEIYPGFCDDVKEIIGEKNYNDSMDNMRNMDDEEFNDGLREIKLKFKELGREGLLKEIKEAIEKAREEAIERLDRLEAEIEANAIRENERIRRECEEYNKKSRFFYTFFISVYAVALATVSALAYKDKIKRFCINGYENVSTSMKNILSKINEKTLKNV